MKANTLRLESYDSTIVCDYGSLTYDPQDLLGCLIWINQHGALDCPVLKRAVGVVTTIGKRFRH